jgi:hypothetical protein
MAAAWQQSQNLDWQNPAHRSRKERHEEGRWTMKRAVITALVGVWAAFGAGQTIAQLSSLTAVSVPSAVVVELFTSQGCSACPPADRMLADLAKRPDVIALALHVDYWDYLGWKDIFGQAAFSARQKAYAHAAGERSVYTPQMIVGGTDALVGANGPELSVLLARHAAKPARIALGVAREGDSFVVEAIANPPLERGTVVQVVRYLPEVRVLITHGENAGKTITYANIVTGWSAVAEWDGKNPLRLSGALEGNDPAVVVIQEALPGRNNPWPGPVLAAARLE